MRGLYCWVFFFSSRRRHTRWTGDWSSDVCSSDLEALGIAYFRIHRYDEAESEFRKLLELAPADDYGHYALGRCLEKQGRQTEAQGHYKLASSLRPASKHYSSRIRDVA